MATKAPRRFRWTRADLDRLPDDGNRYEVLDGELLVTPQAAYAHQRIAFDFALVLHEYCKRHAIGEVVGPGAVVWAKNELQPDVQVIPGHHKPVKGTKWEDLPRPILVVEILSDSTAHRDLGKKREAYLRIGVAEYWAVDIESGLVRVWRKGSPEPMVERTALAWRPRADLAPLVIPLEGVMPR